MWDFTNDKNESGVIPKGNYLVIVDSFEEKTTQAGNQALLLKFKITEGDYKGRIVFQNYNMSGSEKAVQISRGQLKALLEAAGKGAVISGPHDFVGLEVLAAVKVLADEGYGEKNAISYVKKKPAQRQDGVPF